MEGLPFFSIDRAVVLSLIVLCFDFMRLLLQYEFQKPTQPDSIGRAGFGLHCLREGTLILMIGYN